MSINTVYTPKSRNLSQAWGEVFLALMQRGVEELGPVVVSISDVEEDGTPREDSAIRKRVDAELGKLTGRTIDDVADTIFPISLWNKRLEDSGEHTFQRYRKIWPRLRKRSRLNAKGTYFQRMIAFRNDARVVNQLEHVIATYKKGNHRRSALQVGIFNPLEDHSDQRIQGFPCLQQLAFTPSEEGLYVTGYYVLQYALDRAYGNYLGLCRLGAFMAHQMGLAFRGAICISTVLTLGKKKSLLDGLASDIEALVV